MTTRRLMGSGRLANAIQYVSPEKADELRLANIHKHDSRIDDPDIESQLPSSAAASIRQSVRKDVNRQVDGAVKGARRAAKQAAREVEDGLSVPLEQLGKFRAYDNAVTVRDMLTSPLNETKTAWVETVKTKPDDGVVRAAQLRRQRLEAEAAVPEDMLPEEREALIDAIRQRYSVDMKRELGRAAPEMPSAPAPVQMEQQVENEAPMQAEQGEQQKPKAKAFGENRVTRDKSSHRPSHGRR